MVSQEQPDHTRFRLAGSDVPGTAIRRDPTHQIKLLSNNVYVSAANFRNDP